GYDAPLAQLGEAGRPRTLGEPLAIGAEQQRNVRVHGDGEPECLTELDLAWRRAKQVVAAQDVGDARVRVVHDHRELVAGDAVVTEHHEVAHLAGDVLDERPVEKVVHLGRALMRTEAPRRRTVAGPLGSLLVGERETGSRIPWPLIGRSVWRGDGAGDLASCAEARVDAARRPETLERRAVELQAATLKRGDAIEAEPEPGEVGKQGVGELSPGAGGIEVLDPE